jgi:hypothetical protein
MLIFYIGDEAVVHPLVIIDALSSDDRFTTEQITAAAEENVQSGVALDMSNPKIYSCEYSCQFDHVGIPLGQGLKTKFTATIRSIPGELAYAFSPQYLTSAQSVTEMTNALGTIANPQTHITHSAMVIKSANGDMITRQFIVYAAPLYPDSFGTTTIMVLAGAMVDDILFKSEVAFQFDKKTSLKSQLTALLAAQKPALVGNFSSAPTANNPPATERLFQPMKLYDLLDEICLQNKLIYAADTTKSKITFTGVGQKDIPTLSGYTVPEFSFLGSKGSLAWGLGVENYANVKFKSAIFDCKLFGKIAMYNDIQSAFFGGLASRASQVLSDTKIFDLWIIRYSIKWNRSESICEVTATNNWLMSQFRIDGLLEASIYSNAAAGM